MSQLASDAKISSAMAALGMTAPLPNLDDSQVLKAILVALGNVIGGGGGATGDVVGPASSTDGAVVMWDGITGKLIKDSSAFITGSGTLAFGAGPFTLTVPATGTAALLGRAQTFTAANIFSANGAASTPALSLTGTILTGQTGTTNFPHFYIQPTGTTAATTLSTAGTAFGANMPSGFAGDYLHFFNASARALRIACGDFNIPTFYGDATYNYIYFKATVQINNEPLYIAGSVLGLSNSGRTTGAVLDGADTAGLLSQKQATTPCEFDIYGTFTDASNYERMVLRTAAGVYSIKPEAAGTGTLRDLHISGLPTSNPGPGILWNNLGIPAIGT